MMNPYLTLVPLYVLVVAVSAKGGSVAVKSTVRPTLAYTVRQDLRKCASPLCGGLFLKAVNQKKTKCGDGSFADECYVVNLDLSFLASEEDQARLQAAAIDGGIVSGSYTPYKFPGSSTSLFSLIVSAGWSRFEPKCSCAADEVCVDDPSDNCFGCDCPTICRSKVPPQCGGFAGLTCPDGLVCIDDPDDNCDPACNGADCGGICVSLGDTKETCTAGSGTKNTCSAIGYSCYDETGDKCGLGCNTSCPGICAKEVGDFCGGFAAIPCGPGLECVDPLLDGCDNGCGGFDCGGICLPILPTK